jgi:hypothetical protein
MLPEEVRKQLEERMRQWTQEDKRNEVKVEDKWRIKMDTETPEQPGWYSPPTPKAMPKDATEVEAYIRDQVVADTEIVVQDYVHRPNKVIGAGLARIVLFKDGRVAVLTKDVGFFLTPDDIDFIARLSQGQREGAE